MPFFRPSLVACAVLSLLAPLLLSGTAAAETAPTCANFRFDLLERVKPTTSANLLTRSPAEADGAVRYGFTENEGIVARVAGAQGDGLSAIWRLYRPGTLVWAKDGTDADQLVTQGYKKQFVEFYAASNSATCLQPLFRLKRQAVHRIATSAETDQLTKEGWVREAVAFYAAPGVAAPTGPDTDTKFSIAVIPDTGNETMPSANARYKNRATWLAANKAKLDLRYAAQVGDLVNWGNAAPAQFTRASTDLQPLEAVVPWSGAIGNHDTGAVCVGGSACPGANASQTVRNTTAYNKAFPVSRFPNMAGTFEPGKVDNSYQTFRAGGVNWLVLTLEIWPRQSAVAWANSVVAGHPQHNVIVVTHDYLTDTGAISGSNGGYGATAPRYLYDNLIKVYPNIKLVLTSHVGTSTSRTDVGIKGNKLVSLLQHFHSSTNPVRLVEIDTAAGTITSRVYAPYTNTSYPSYDTATNGLTFVR